MTESLTETPLIISFFFSTPIFMNFFSVKLFQPEIAPTCILKVKVVQLISFPIVVKKNGCVILHIILYCCTCTGY